MKTKTVITVHNPHVTEPPKKLAGGLYQSNKKYIKPSKLKDLPPYFKKHQ